ncbi:MAG: CRISPR-associated protein Csx11, partial [Candidatus Helarchaeota archaeon]
DQMANFLDGKDIKIKNGVKGWINAKIVETRPADQIFQNYLPFVKIYDFPTQFMVLIPSYESLDIAERILNEYEIQFSKVRDRLPFHLGLISFHRKTPLYVVMDAGRKMVNAFKKKSKEFQEKMENGKIEIKVISIKDIEDENLGKSREVEIKAEDYSPVPLKWRISKSTKDPEVEDLWYPYIRIKNHYPDRKLSFDYTGKKDYVVHLKELKENDIIKIEPSYFKLFYLENASDRFKVDEDLRPLDDIHRIKRLWEKIKFKVNSMSQIYAYREDIRKRRSYDQSEFKRFIKSDLINILNVSPIEDCDLFKEFYQATKDGLLEICLYWNFQVRKKKLEVLEK